MLLQTFESFIADIDAWDMFIEGPAGTGKTTSLRELVQYCIDNNIPYTVCAYTHKACGILMSKLPLGARVQTLHSYLRKRPAINQDATKQEHVNINVRTGAIDEVPKVMFLDEYSMVGEKDYMDIREKQDPEYEGAPDLKVVYIGDPHQLPPVGDMQTVSADGDYIVRLTKIYRNDNPLQTPLTKLIGMIEGGKPEPIDEVPGYFERGRDIVGLYERDTEDRVILAYTNRRVQELNAMLEGYDLPEENNHEGSILFSPTTNKTYTFERWVPLDEVTQISIHYSDPLSLGSKYKTLEHLIHTELCDFIEVLDEENEPQVFAVVFGHYDYRQKLNDLTKAAADSNKAIEDQFKGYKAAGWARANPTHPLARARSKAWRDCLSFKDCVICLDWPYAMTVHKSQGSTYEHVYIDTDDLYIAATRDFSMYVKLMYVAISRASKKVITS